MAGMPWIYWPTASSPSYRRSVALQMICKHGRPVATVVLTLFFAYGIVVSFELDEIYSKGILSSFARTSTLRCPKEEGAEVKEYYVRGA
jgi:uncharacterized Rmd1/YagE family protein